MIRVEITESTFFKTWNYMLAGFRIIKHKGIKSFYPYELQEQAANGCWRRIGNFHTLKEAKAAAGV